MLMCLFLAIVEQLQRELATLEIRNRELEQVLEKLREENWQLKQKVTSSPGVLNGDNCAAPPPPPPPPPPPGLLSPPASIAQIVKQRRSEGVHSGKLNDNVKKDEASSRQNQLIMEVVNFLKSGGFSKSKRQRSLTQPDFSQELAKFKESRGIETAKDIAIEKFKSLKKRSEKGVCLAKELDSLKTSQKNNESSKDTSPLSTPDQTGRRTVTVSKIRSFNNNGTLADATAKCVIVSETKTASVADLLLKLEQISGDGTRSGSKPSTPAASRISSPQSVRKNSSVKQNCFIDRDGLVMDTNDTMADNIEEREAQVTFAIDRPSSEASLRCQSRSSGIASSLFSERLSDSSLTSETDQEPDDKGWLRATKCASPQIIITSVDDPAENLVDEAFQKASTKVGIDEINRPDERHPQQEFSVATSFPLTKVIENGVNGLRLRPPTIFQVGGSGKILQMFMIIRVCWSVVSPFLSLQPSVQNSSGSFFFIVTDAGNSATVNKEQTTFLGRGRCAEGTILNEDLNSSRKPKSNT